MSNIIVMAFSPRNIIRCFLKKTLTKGCEGGRHGHPRTPLATPLQSGKVHVKSYFRILIQGPKLTVLCRRQVATEIFFSVAK